MLTYKIRNQRRALLLHLFVRKHPDIFSWPTSHDTGSLRPEWTEHTRSSRSLLHQTCWLQAGSVDASKQQCWGRVVCMCVYVCVFTSQHTTARRTTMIRKLHSAETPATVQTFKVHTSQNPQPALKQDDDAEKHKLLHPLSHKRLQERLHEGPGCCYFSLLHV